MTPIEQMEQTGSIEIDIKRKTQVIDRDESKVMCRLFMYGGDTERIKKTIKRITKLNEQETSQLLEEVVEDFSDRHRNIKEIFERHFEQINIYISSIDYSFSKKVELLIGAYSTMEYAVESAALFNPSIVPHPDQSSVDEGCMRFVMSLRAVGEGHISSVVFRGGIINEQGEIKFDDSSSYVNQPEVENPDYDKDTFNEKLNELEADEEISSHILDQLPDKFTQEDLQNKMDELDDEPKFSTQRQLQCIHNMHRVAESNYQLHFDPESDLSERVIFPVSETEQGGIEDARFTPFEHENGEITYYATYTAYDGSSATPQLMETKDFDHFEIRSLYGKAIKDKDMALFPRKVNGQYVMLSRQDGVNNRIMFSDDLRHWQESQIIQKPTEPWELIQMGNCGAPLETSEGWLVLMHGVGPVRTYSIGAILLDLDDPTKILKRLKKPLIKALEHQQIGYVPNVVYTCGALVHNGQLVIPYALSDIQPAIARVKLDDVLDAMEPMS